MNIRLLSEFGFVKTDRQGKRYYSQFVKLAYSFFDKFIYMAKIAIQILVNEDCAERTRS